MERVVITGIGVISSIGTGIKEFTKSLKDGWDGISRVESFETGEFSTDRGGEIKNFVPYLRRISADNFAATAVYSASAARMAAEDAHADTIDLNRKCSAIIGTTMGEGTEKVEIMRRSLNGGDFGDCSRMPDFRIAQAVCREMEFHGGAEVIPNACAAGNSAVIRAYEQIRRGRIEYAFAGGADTLSRSAFIGFTRLRSLADGVCRPFDKNRSGLLIGEGAGVLFMESLRSALSRNVHIYAEVIGWGASCDAYHSVMPRPDAYGIKKAMNDALRSAMIDKNDVDYICAHGTGTHANDKAEAKAVNEIFGRRLPVSSVKSMIGHAMGAASALEAAACCAALKYGFIPPTINFTEPDEECDIDCVPNISREADIRIAVNNAYAFGGNNTSIVLKRYNDYE